MDTVEINRLVVDREKARKANDYDLSDTLRSQLQAGGVTLYDKQNLWRAADGRSGRIPTWAQVEQMENVGSGTFEAPMSLDRTMPPPPGADVAVIDPEVAHIKQLVQMREKARAAKSFTESDSIRDQLHALDVEVLDKEKLWRAKSGASGVIIGYSGEPTELEITTLVTQREKARQENDYTTADMIRRELKAVGVDIHDKQKMWISSDGRKGPVPSWQGLQQPPPPQGRPAMQNFATLTLPDGMQIRIEGPMLSRVMAMLQAPQPVQAPPRPPPPAYTHAHGPRQASVPRAAQEAINFINSCARQGGRISDADIQWLIETREGLRKARDFSSADIVRDAVRSQLGVEIHEKEKRWACSDGRSGEVPMWDAVA